MRKDLNIVELENDDILLQLEGDVVTWSELNGKPESNAALIALLTKLLENKLDKVEREAGTHTKITYDEYGLVVNGEELSLEDLPELHLENIVDVEATAEEVNKLHGLQTTREELEKLHGLLLTTIELNKLKGLDVTAQDLNKIKDINIDEDKIKDIQKLIPDLASEDNKLATEQFVRNWVDDHAGYLVCKDIHNTNFESFADLQNCHRFYHNGELKRINTNDYAIVLRDETKNGGITRYNWVKDQIYNEGHWIFQYPLTKDNEDLTLKWGNIKGDIKDQADLIAEIDAIKEDISGDIESITDDIKDIQDTLEAQGDIVTHNADEFLAMANIHIVSEMPAEPIENHFYFVIEGESTKHEYDPLTGDIDFLELTIVSDTDGELVLNCEDFADEGLGS